MKPENTFIRSIDRYIPQVYSEKMANPWRSGTADKWYTGVKADLWVEYKWVSSVPAVALPALSPRQTAWLAGRLEEKRKVAVVVGCTAGGVIYLNREWETPIHRSAFLALILSRKEIASWIFDITGASPCKLNALPLQQPTSSKPHIKV